MATVVGPSFKVGGPSFEPPGWATASQADRDLYGQALLQLVLKAKDSELKAGLDRYGKPMARLAPSTIANRRSAMGKADPGAPPLQPAHGLSRTRALLTGKATAGGVVCWWLVDKHTNDTWGEILKHHRAGSSRLPKRDVIGLSPQAKAQVRQRAFAWWSKHLAKVQGFDFSVGSAEVVVEAQQPGGQWSGWHTAAEVKAQLASLGIVKKAGGGYDSSAYWAAKKAAKNPPPPPKPPSLPRRDPKPPTPAEPLGDYLPSDEDLAKPTASPFAFKPPKAKKKAPKPAAAPTPPPAPPKPKAKAKPKVDPFPADLKGLVEVKALGGSTGAKLVEDPRTGRRYVLKRGGNPGHLKNEAHADALYRAAGVDVPDSRVYDDGGKPAKLAAFHEGKALGELMRTDPAAFAAAVEKLRKGFAADALLGNWDVVGMSLDNVLVLPDGRVLRIDNGGALAYRAQGALKTSAQWSSTSVGELASLRSTGVNPSAGLVYGPMTDDDVRAGIKELLKRRAKILAAAPDPATRAVLEGRLAAMEAWAKPAKKTAAGFPDGWKPSPAAKFHKPDDAGRRAWIDRHYGDGKTSQWWKSLSAVERAAVKDYTGSGYHDFNGWHRGKTTTKPHLIDERTTNLDAALAKKPAPEGIVMYRGIGNPTPVLQALGISSRAELKVGMDIMDPSYISTSPNPAKAWGGLKLEIRVHAGTHGAYVGTNSTHKSEEEFILGRETDTLRIVEITPDWIVVEALSSKDLAAKAQAKAKPKKKGPKP